MGSNSGAGVEYLGSYMKIPGWGTMTLMQQLMEIEGRMREVGLPVPTTLGFGYPFTIDPELMAEALLIVWKGDEIPNDYRPFIPELLLGSTWEMLKLMFEPTGPSPARVLVQHERGLKPCIKSKKCKYPLRKHKKTHFGGLDLREFDEDDPPDENLGDDTFKIPEDGETIEDAKQQRDEELEQEQKRQEEKQRQEERRLQEEKARKKQR
ncbi:hypothetical protein QVD99_000056 [Batrachochytrium dendrobatidis]|nr:hypothetical protein QVD99_000056 [Batrachochytrium dendrobatidis]